MSGASIVIVRLLQEFGGYRPGDLAHVASWKAQLWCELRIAELVVPSSRETAMAQAPERAIPPPARAREVRGG